MTRNRIQLGLLLCPVIAILGYRQSPEKSITNMGLQQIANGDAQFWLMQGAPNDHLLPCTVYYQFDTPINESIVRDRLDELVTSYAMFNRNIVEIDDLPYWQSVDVDWSQNFKILDAGEDIESVRQQAEVDVSRAVELGEGLPLFRAYLSSDRKQLGFIWHHVISDFEGMLNKHAKHLFKEEGERTQFGYQIDQTTKPGDNERLSTPAARFLDVLNDTDSKLGFYKASYKVTKLVLPIKDKAL